MIKIYLKNGKVYDNNPKLGWNMDTIDQIENCLKLTGRYWLTLAERGYSIIIYPKEVEWIESVRR